MICRFVLLVLVGSLSARTCASTLLGPGLDDLDRETGIIGTEERFLNFELFRPPGFESASQLPLFVFLHGFSDGQPENNERQLHPTIHEVIHATQRENAYRIGDTPEARVADDALASFLLVPKVPVRAGWAAYDDLTLELIDDISERYAVDGRRVYLAGFSDGGFATIRLMEQYSDKFAAGVSIAGGGLATPERVAALVDTPLWFVHDLQDSVVPASWSIDLFESLRDAGAPVKSLFSDGVVDHGSWSLAFRRNTPVYPWLFAQSLAVPEPASICLVLFGLVPGSTRRRG